ncbi:UPF0449 protein C19orf25 homolog [Diprion similis]|uniref:UPF0449 protein C19orf25 homolog n=1 Tax=Diprion similis TaxID=362088 RepID=UPI001EF92B59|nr:UPF0449 protein C19orf25 homolog [Diprion similis]
MFGNKKNNLPPRPHPLLPEQVLEDILNANKDDVVFIFNNKEESGGENLHYPMNTNDAESVYARLKIYLNVKESLKKLSGALSMKNESLQSANVEMQRMAEGIRKQAQDALVKQ